MTRGSCFTYKQIVIRAIIDLEQERGQFTFHSNSVHAKIRRLESADDIDLGPFRTQHVTRAINDLINEGVLRKTTRIGHKALSPKGRKRLTDSRKHYGPFDRLSPFKKSQFLKAIAGTSSAISPASSVTSTPTKTGDLLKKLQAQEKLIKSLRASLRTTKEEKKLILEKLDDRELELLDLTRFSISPTPDNTSPDSQENGRAESQQTLLFNRETNPTLILTPPSTEPRTAVRPSAMFTHRPSGSFFNTVSNQFTPSPSPGPGRPISNSDTALGVGPTSDIDSESSDDDDDFGHVDLDFKDMHTMESARDDNSTEGRMDVDAGMPQGMGRDALAKILDLEARLAASERNAAVLADAAKELAAAIEEKQLLNTRLTLVTQERDALKDATSKLEGTVQDRDRQIKELQKHLAFAIQGRDELESTDTGIQDELHQIGQDNTSMGSESARLPAAITRHVNKVASLNIRIGTLTTELSESNAQRDEARAREMRTATQLAATQGQLQITGAYLAATDAQLKGIQSDLRMVWYELQESHKQGTIMRKQLAETENQLQGTRKELQMTKTQFDDTAVRFQATNNQLAITTAQLDIMHLDLQRVQDELRASKVQHDSALAGLDAKDEELRVTHAALGNTRGELQDTQQALQSSRANLQATDARLNQVQSALQTAQADLQQASEREQELKTKLHTAEVSLVNAHVKLESVARDAVDKQKFLATQLEDAQEEVALAQGDLERIRAAWEHAVEKKRAAAEADAQIQQMLLRRPTPKRDASFRDSGVSFV